MKTKAFTLAELLMSLTIIGVIAALTLPVVFTTSNNKKYYAGYRKALAIGNDAIQVQIASGKYKQMGGRFNSTAGPENFKEFSNYFLKRKECFSGNNSQCWNPDGEKLYSNSQPDSSALAFVDQSGMAWSLYNNSENIMLVDINGDKKPNEYGKDRWYFVPVNKDGLREGCYGTGKAVGLSVYNSMNDGASASISDINSYSGAWCQHPPCKLKSALIEN